MAKRCHRQLSGAHRRSLLPLKSIVANLLMVGFVDGGCRYTSGQMWIGAVLDLNLGPSFVKRRMERGRVMRLGVDGGPRSQFGRSGNLRQFSAGWS